MDMTTRIGFLATVALLAVACGGASNDSIEPTAGGTSRLDKGGETDPAKPDESDCTKPGDPTDPKDPNAGGSCFWAGEGSESSCKSPDVWKDYAWQTCQAKGTELTNLTFGESCDNGGYRYAKFECCSAAVPPKDPEPSSCIGEYANGICQSEAAWKDTAAKKCAGIGLTLGDIGYGSTCGKAGEVSEVKFTCCK